MIKIDVNPKQLYEGCIQAAIAHAVAVGKYPELNYEQSWDGMTYCINNSQGCRAAITFHNKYIIAVFRDNQKADRNAEALDFFTGAPESIIQVAKEEALQYVLEDVQGVAKPIITAAFWGTWEQLNSTRSFDDITENGGYIIEPQLLPYNDAVEVWRDHYDLDASQIALIKKLFDKKISSNGNPIALQDDEMQLLYGDIEECLASLEELNFFSAK